MNFKDIEPGMKVTPIAQTARCDGQGLFRSEVWKNAKRVSQPFLFVQKKRSEGDFEECLLVVDRNDKVGQYINCVEFEKYVE